MPLKEMFCGSHGRTVKMGRNRPRAIMRGVALAEAQFKLNVVPPPTCDYSPAAMSSLGNILGNADLGDCVIAMGYHAQGVFTGNAGQCFVPSMQQIIADYAAIGGYVPGNPATDNGCDETVAMKYWTDHGFANGDRLVGAILIPANDPNLVRQCIWLFENVGFGCELPDQAIHPMPHAPGFTWDVAGAPNPDNGHAFLGYGYGPGAIKIDTWGLIPGMVTDGFVAKYATQSANGNLWAMLSRMMLVAAQQKAPNGADWATIVSAFDQLGGNVPIPGPGPGPGPTPPPPPPPPVGSIIVVDPASRSINVPSGIRVINQPVPQILYYPGRSTIAFNHANWRASTSPASSGTINIDVTNHTVHVPTGFMPVHMPGQVVEIFPGRHAVSWPQGWHRS